MTTFNLNIFDNKVTLEAHIKALIHKRNKIGKILNPTKQERILKDELTIQIIILSEISEIDY